MFGDYTTVKLLRLFQRKRFGEIFHNLLIPIDFSEWKYVIFSPRTQNKPIGLNHNKNGCKPSSTNIVGVNSTI